MTRMGHDSPAAALTYQHSSRVADEAIATALGRAVECSQIGDHQRMSWGPAKSRNLWWWADLIGGNPL